MREYWFGVLVCLVHFFIFLIALTAATVVRPSLGMVVTGIFVMSWISIAVSWKQRCDHAIKLARTSIDQTKLLLDERELPGSEDFSVFSPELQARIKKSLADGEKLKRDIRKIIERGE